MSNYPKGIWEGSPDAPWNCERTPEEAAISLHPSADWYAAQVLRALQDWKEETPDVLDYWEIDPIEAMSKILDGFEKWFIE